ncbi:MAG: transcription termination factor NusA [Bacteroidales bacterium]|nr:transcription termination factor NusA [Bacteroidales bacterium]
MDKISLKDAFSEFKKQKNIDKNTMTGVLVDVFKTQLAKVYGTADNCDVIVNVDKGDCEIYRTLEVVETVEDPATQIAASDEKIAGEDYEIGDEYVETISLADFGRRGILNIKQNLSGKIMDIDRANTYNKYIDMVGEIFVGTVYQTWAKEVLLLDGESNELRLPRSEQIPGEHFKKGDNVKAIIKSVEMKNNSAPSIILSRTCDAFLEKLFESEVPEIYDGLITIKKVVRIPGERAKVAVESYDDRIDPIGACIGVKGSRISGIVRELRNENIDVIPWTTNTQLLIQRAMNPARVNSISISPEGDKVIVYMDKDEVKKGIGRGGCNVRLTGMLVGKEIEVWREGESWDVLLDDFIGDIDEWVIEKLHSIGCDTAKAVLALSQEDVAERADLDIETVADVFNILSAEFEDEENEAQPEQAA